MDAFETVARVFLQGVGLLMVLGAFIGLGKWYYRNILRDPRRRP